MDCMLNELDLGSNRHWLSAPLKWTLLSLHKSPSNLCQLKANKGDNLASRGPHCVCVYFFLYNSASTWSVSCTSYVTDQISWVCVAQSIDWLIRPTYVEQLATARMTRHELCAFPAWTENISVSELVNHGARWLFAIMCHRNTLTYLLNGI